MRTTTREDFSRWLDEKVLNPVSEGPQVDVLVSKDLKAASPLSRAANKARERARARRLSMPGGIASVMAGGYTQGFKQALRLPASFQLVKVDGLETLEKGACTVLFSQAVACVFQGRATHYYDPETMRLLGWEQASRVLSFDLALSEPAHWQIGRSYALGSSTVCHKDGRLLESFVQRAEISEANPVSKMSALAKRLQPTFPSAADTRAFSLALRSFAVDDTSDQSAVLELFEFELGPRGLKTKSHNICSVQESLEFGNVLLMTMIRCP
ncbi:MAG: hypothetical protein EBT99_07595 [Betaproteobacteria bacterium]|nr:hypothetical protein [Betaproteobacteria bacterium]